MNGVTVLSTVHEQVPLIKWIMLYISFIGFVMVTLSMCTLLFRDGIYFSITHEILLMIGMLLLFIFLPISGEINDIRYIYATIESDTSINVLLNKYEVMDIDGDLYKLKIIDNKKN